jgi:hypothetical protein
MLKNEPVPRVGRVGRALGIVRAMDERELNEFLEALARMRIG